MISERQLLNRLFKVFCSVGLLLCLWLLANLILTSSPQDTEEYIANGVSIVLFIPVTILFALPLICRWKPWIWGLGILLLLMGTISFFGAPLALPLLIFWVHPETKKWFKEMTPPSAEGAEYE